MKRQSGSDKSLYQIEGGLKYKALILAEAQALESHGRKDNELAYAIRTLVSEGSLKYQYTGFKDKKRVTIIKTIEGPTSLLTTSIKGHLEDQLDDRMITAHPNTTTAQTVNIIEQTAATACGIGNQVDENLDAIRSDGNRRTRNQETEGESSIQALSGLNLSRL